MRSIIASVSPTDWIGWNFREPQGMKNAGAFSQNHLNLGIKTYLNGTLTSNILIDTSQGAQPTLIGAAAEIDDRGRNMDMSSAG
jgi:hypothetical protein